MNEGAGNWNPVSLVPRPELCAAFPDPDAQHWPGILLCCGWFTSPRLAGPAGSDVPGVGTPSLARVLPWPAHSWHGADTLGAPGERLMAECSVNRSAVRPSLFVLSRKWVIFESLL